MLIEDVIESYHKVWRFPVLRGVKLPAMACRLV